MGAALVQQQGEETRIVGYFSKKLSCTQRKYAAVEKECLGVLLAIDNFRHYVEGTRFKVVTDARNLLRLFKIGAESGNSKLLRWALRIQSYDIELEYRKGKNNITADCLSRSIDMITVNQPDPEYGELTGKIQNDPVRSSEYCVIDGKIWKHIKGMGRQSDPRFSWKQFPTQAERASIMEREHNKAHFGFEKTLTAIKERHFWPKMKEQIRKFCRECLSCQTSEAGNKRVTPPMGSKNRWNTRGSSSLWTSSGRYQRLDETVAPAYW